MSIAVMSRQVAYTNTTKPGLICRINRLIKAPHQSSNVALTHDQIPEQPSVTAHSDADFSHNYNRRESDIRDFQYRFDKEDDFDDQVLGFLQDEMLPHKNYSRSVFLRSYQLSRYKSCDDEPGNHRIGRLIRSTKLRCLLSRVKSLAWAVLACSRMSKMKRRST